MGKEKPYNNRFHLPSLGRHTRCLRNGCAGSPTRPSFPGRSLRASFAGESSVIRTQEYLRDLEKSKIAFGLANRMENCGRKNRVYGGFRKTVQIQTYGAIVWPSAINERKMPDYIQPLFYQIKQI